MFKLWDTRNWLCIQTFHGDDLLRRTVKNARGDTTAMSFSYDSTHRRIVVGARRLHFFDYDAPSDPRIADEAPTVDVDYNSESMTIVTAAGKGVRLWDAATGRLVKHHERLSSAELTAFCMDDRQRKLIVGDHVGRIAVHKALSGAHMCQLRPHQSSVCAVRFSAGSGTLVSASWDGCVAIHDITTDPSNDLLLRSIRHADGLRQLLPDL